MTREELLKSSAYWFEYEQNELFRQVTRFMEDENINQTELAAKLNVSKGYISQILNGNFNYTLKKLIELCLAIGMVPKIRYNKMDNIIREDADMRSFYDNYAFDYDNNIIQLSSDVEIKEYKQMDKYASIPLKQVYGN